MDHQEFEKFHADHPEVYAQLARLTREAKAAKFHRFGIRQIWEVMRWHFAITTPSGSAWKLNDHLTPFYSRLLMQQEPDLAGFFETRTRKSEGGSHAQ
jgi:hypothetical protein